METMYTHWERPNKKPFYEKEDKTTLVEVAGYIPAKQRIENLILAGERLVAWRKEQFDFNDGEIDEDFEDPTRSKNYDIVDAKEDMEAIENRVYTRRKKAEEEAENAKITSQSRTIPVKDGDNTRKDTDSGKSGN